MNDVDRRALSRLRGFDAPFRLGSELLAARRSADMTQRELAALSGVQQAEISRIERCHVVPKISTLEQLLVPLGRRLAIAEDRDPLEA